MIDEPIAARVVERAGHRARLPTRHRRYVSAADAPTSAPLLWARPDWQAILTRPGVGRAMRTVIEIDPRSVDILDQAEREHYRIMACTLCGGPEVHAKHKPAAKCVRCGHYRTLEQITPLVTRQRCQRCQETFWAVLKTTTCANCRGKWTQEPKITPARPSRATLVRVESLSRSGQSARGN
jgi:hypothetical protein